MEREKILDILSQTYDKVYGEYQTLMSLGTQLLHDGKHRTYHEVERYINGKTCLLDGISMAAASLGIDWDELVKRTAGKGEQK